jgi:hypothetical protein
MARGRGNGIERGSALRSQADQTPWHDHGPATNIEEWAQQAEAIARAAHGSPDEEHFLHLANVDFAAFADRYPCVDEDGEEVVGRASGWRFGYSVAENNGSDIWLLVRVPFEGPGDTPVQINAAVRLVNIEDERVDPERATWWANKMFTKRIAPGPGVFVCLSRNSGTIEITHSRQPR